MITIGKLGRPIKSDEKKEVSLHLRITSTEAERIKKCSQEVGLNRTDTIMQGISLLEQKIAEDKK